MRRLLFVLVLAVACGGDKAPSAPSAPDVTGTWQAISINGTSFPVLYTALNFVDYSDALTIRQDGGYTRLTTSGFANATSRSTFQELGHWGVSGDVVVLAPNVPSGITQYRATLTAGDLRMEIGNQIWLYRRP